MCSLLDWSSSPHSTFDILKLCWGICKNQLLLVRFDNISGFKSCLSLNCDSNCWWCHSSVILYGFSRRIVILRIICGVLIQGGLNVTSLLAKTSYCIAVLDWEMLQCCDCSCVSISACQCLERLACRLLLLLLLGLSSASLPIYSPSQLKRHAAQDLILAGWRSHYSDRLLRSWPSPYKKLD